MPESTHYCPHVLGHACCPACPGAGRYCSGCGRGPDDKNTAGSRVPRRPLLPNEPLSASTKAWRDGEEPLVKSEQALLPV